MTPIRNLLSDAVRYGLAAGAVGFAGLASASAFAQDTTAPAADSAKAKEVGRVEVIGSRIKRAVDTEPTAPVTTMTRADIAQTGLTSTFDVLNHLTASDGTGLSTVTTATNGSDGSTNISLRNLGPQRTLILVDGKRWPTDIAGVVDVSSIPLAIIERVEVLKDGASTIYGSDAIAGVINIITRKKFEGAQLNWSYGQTTHGDGAQNSEDATIGANGEHTNAVISISRSQQKEIFAGNRAISNFQHYGCQALFQPGGDPTGILSGSGAAHGAGCGSSNPAFGRIFISDVKNLTTTTTTAKGAKVMGPTALGSFALNNSFNDGKFQNADPNTAHQTSATGGLSPTDFHHFTAYDRYNFAPVNYLQQPQTRNNFFGAGNFDINDNVTAYARVSYTQRQSAQQIAQVPGNLSNPDYVDANGVHHGGQSTFGPQWDFVPSTNSFFNPWKNDPNLVITDFHTRFVAVGPRHNSYDFNTLGSTAGLRGSFQVADRNFDWDVYAQYNSEHDSLVGTNYINLFNLRNAVGPSFRDNGGILRCGTPGNVIANCVPYNIFGGPDLGLGAGVISKAEYQAMINYVSYTLVNSNSNKGYNYGGNISGEIAPLQGGMLAFAAGVEQRRSTARSTPDALVSAGGSSNNFQLPSNGGTKSQDEYLEVDAPLLKGVPGAQELELDAAVRHSNITGSGVLGTTPVTNNAGSPTESKFSLRWKPFNDLLVRASYGGTFRAPSVNDLYSGQTENFPFATDPCSNTVINSLPAAGKAVCLAQGVPAAGIDTSTASGQVRALSGGNPNLKPEHGHDFTTGLVYSPSWAKGLNLTIDYWRVNLKDAIQAQGAGTTFGLCYQSANPDPTSCGLVHRDPISHQITFVQGYSFNAATFKTDGIDTGLTYHYETPSWGNFDLKWDATYNRHVNVNGINFVGSYANGPTWKWRSAATIGWTRGDWDASWTIRYVSALDEAQGCSKPNVTGTTLICNHPGQFSSNPAVNNGAVSPGYNRLGAVTYHDIRVGWKAPWKAHISIGARNVFGKEPPLANSAGQSSFDGAYDLPGGAYYYMQYSQNF
ncbi:MAG: TonB-dependent receptor [Proteobacteria bacterium]|nr:TonB-dependent receptor [Pseudomonadota bacterium]